MITTLDEIWFCTSPVDYEMKQYILLAYLQKLDKALKESDLTHFDEIKRHLKNLESFLTTREILDADLSESKRKVFKDVTAVPDDNKTLNEIFKICRWAITKLQKKYKEFGIRYKQIESSMSTYYIGQMTGKFSGYLMLRYFGSDVAEVYKVTYEEKGKTVTFRFYKNYMMPEMKDFSDVKFQVLEDEKKMDDMFIAVESELAYDTKKTVLPVLKNFLVTNVFDMTNKLFLGFKL